MASTFKSKLEEKKSIVTIYHHDDMDGYASAAIIASIHQYNHDVRLIEVSHGSKPLDLSNIDVKKKNIIYILDYSLSSDEEIINLNNFMSQNQNQLVIFIDHHETSYALIDGNSCMENKFISDAIYDHGIISTRVSAAVLCYLFKKILKDWYYMLDDENDIVLNKIRQLPDAITKDITGNDYVLFNDLPYWLALINDYDLWKLDYPDSQAFNLACYAEGLYEVFMRNVYTYIINFDDKGMRTFTNSLISKGFAILDYQNKNNARIMNNSFECEMIFQFKQNDIDPNNVLNLEEGIESKSCKCLCVNGYGNSSIFGKFYNEYDAVVIFNYDGSIGKYKYTMYSKENGFQCNVAALFFKKKYGLNGGGHYHAAGWSSPELLFEAHHEPYVFTLDD